MDQTVVPHMEDAGLGLRTLEPELLRTGEATDEQQHGRPALAASAPCPASKHERLWVLLLRCLTFIMQIVCKIFPVSETNLPPFPFKEM